MNRTKMYPFPEGTPPLYSWNPIVGCSPVSAGCDNCWARSYARRFYPEAIDKPILFPDRLDQPLKVKKPAMIATCFMGDLFHEAVPFEFIDQVLRMTAQAGWHKYLLLTKRPQNILRFLDWSSEKYGIDFANDGGKFPIHLWLGVSVEDQETAEERIPILLQIPAAVRWISVEPMLEEIKFKIPRNHVEKRNQGWESGPDWVVLGGETGPRARQLELDWVRKVRDDCVAAGVPFFLKSLGKGKGRVLDGRTWDEMPEVK